jgi:uncharacterized protein (DUF2147 family)
MGEAAMKFLALAAALLASSGISAAAEPAGVWSTPEAKARVKIADCGGGLCATIVSLKEPTDDKGAPKLDIHNADASKRGRPILGLPLLTGMKADGGQWRGRIYNPEDGKTYAAYMTEQGGAKLKIQGCALGGLLCKTQIWTRVQ